MSSIKIKIKFPFFGKEKREKIETIEFSKIKDHMKKLKDERGISEYYDELEKSYENFMNKLGEVKKAFEDLENKGENKFTPLVKNNLEKIKELDEFNVSSFQQFYTDSFHTIDKIVKIPARIQHEALSYEESKEAMDLLNSFLKNLKKLKNILAKRYSEYNLVNHFENALKKHKQIEESMKKIDIVEEKIESVMKEEEHVKKLLEEKVNNIHDIKLRVDNKKITKLEKQISSLDNKVRVVQSYIRMNLLSARRPISKILYSKEDKRLFEFFKKITEDPLENINENFWKIISIIEKENLSEDRRINEFLKFVENELNNKIIEYKNIEMKKKKLKDVLKQTLSKNKDVLENFEKEKESTEKILKVIHKKLNDLKKEKNDLELIIRKGIKTLEMMLRKVSNHKVRIRVDYLNQT